MKQNGRKFGLNLAALMLALLLVGTAVLAPCLVSAEDGGGGVIQDSRGIRTDGAGGGEPVAPSFGSPGEGDLLFEQPPITSNISARFMVSDTEPGYICLDDFWGLTGGIGDIHWYGLSAYCCIFDDCDPTGMEFEIIFYEDAGGSPGDPVAVFSNVIPTITYYDTFDGRTAYRFDVAKLETPVSLTEGWVSIYSTSSPYGCWFLWANSPTGNLNAIQQPYGPLNPPANLAFALTEGGLEFGDAPEGVLAYPATGVTGAFPTCMNVTIAGWVQHNNFGTWFGPTFDFEYDGNHGLCPGFAPYDNDECFQDGDAGLILPEPYTIQGGIVATCGNSAGTPLGGPCELAQWGSDIDILIHNWMPNHEPYVEGYVNVLIDWNQDGQWQNDPATTCDDTMVPEHVLVNFVIPPRYDGTLSALGPPNFQIGPNDGYVWVRFSITEQSVGGNWTGEGAFEDGETEDYLLRVYVPPPVGGEAYPVSKASLLAPWIAVGLVLAGGISWYFLRRRRARS